ncbi:MoaF C-terminal domain-containing protein [Providencia stuartii]|uniref:MoaF C-terminal domain-containing protein n=1 Tax=Providencia stuartii TaxID=588 RepID=UPI0023E0FB20|nr:MoaF C-terminal domain-containing protein [Providencia stuartii]WER22717.1 MoaF C-terminal domain-containing protein [Providencia stuartii]WER26837.1 MoaF C-terminal domain-containing protein [Providencia stuartii]WER30927.1 MoaF C-terminal domain-containing protein [Providencia stuartii]
MADQIVSDTSFDAFAKELKINRIKRSYKIINVEFNLCLNNENFYFRIDERDRIITNSVFLSDYIDSKNQKISDLTEVAENVFLIELSKGNIDFAHSILVLDLNNSNVILLSSQYQPSKKITPRFEQNYHLGKIIGDNLYTAAPTETRDLLGLHILNEYSDSTAVEHIYINSQWYAYHIYGGVRHGECDCDQATYLKIKDDVYLLGFRELAVDVAIILVLDFKLMRNTGFAIGYTDEQWFSIPIGAHMKKINKRLDDYNHHAL